MAHIPIREVTKKWPQILAVVSTGKDRQFSEFGI